MLSIEIGFSAEPPSGIEAANFGNNEVLSA